MSCSVGSRYRRRSGATVTAARQRRTCQQSQVRHGGGHDSLQPGGVRRGQRVSSILQLMSAPQHCRRVVLARRPVGMPVAEDFRVEAAALREIADDELLIENLLLAIDPAIRGFLDDRPSYLPPVAIGEAVR